MCIGKGVRAVEGASLENWCVGNDTVGSNPTPSAKYAGMKNTKVTMGNNLTPNNAQHSKPRISSLRRYKFEAVNLVVGAVVLTFELVASRVIAPYLGTTIYVWTSIIGIILASLAIGYSIGGYLADKRHKSEDIVFLLILAAILIILVDLIKDWGLNRIAHIPIGLQWQALLASVLLFSIPTIVLGTISPYLVRLSLKSIATSGRQVARINAAGTIGALVGTFLTGYLLFGFVGTRYILGLLAVALCLASFIMDYRHLVAHRLLLLLITSLFSIFPIRLHIEGIVGDLDSRYSRIMIRDIYYNKRPLRVLQTDSQIWQSGIYKNGNRSLVFPYANAFALAARSRPFANKYLIIGGGAFNFPEYLSNNYPKAQIDVVEIDGRLTTVSNDFFGLKPHKNLDTVEADGRQFLNNNTNRYDIIFMDAYSSLIPPFQLFTKEAVMHIKSSLTTNGLAVINLVSSSRNPRQGFIAGSARTYKQFFANVDVFEADVDRQANQRQNLILLASDNKLPVSLGVLSKDYLGPRDKLFGKRVNVQISSGRVFTDDFSPVERLVVSGPK